jgi:hypothetical protein
MWLILMGVRRTFCAARVEPLRGAFSSGAETLDSRRKASAQNLAGHPILIGVLRVMDPALEEAASVAGASRLRSVLFVTVALMAPGIVAISSSC